MQARFKQFTKRQNSTKRPTGLQLYNVTLKGPCSILKPRLEIKWTGTGDPTMYNMVYISTFGRYYWITNWTYEDRCWVCDCKVDVLASYKTQIGNSSKYILRAADDVNPAVIDDFYPATGQMLISKTAVTGFGFNTDLVLGGKYIVSIVGEGNTWGTGGVGYVALDITQYNALIDAAFTNGITEPYQYINSAIWLPLSSLQNTIHVTGLKLGTVSTIVDGYAFTDYVSVYTWTQAINTSPAGSGTAEWKNIAPFTQYVLNIPPFGVFDLDTVQLYGHTSLVFTMRVEVTTGEAYLEVVATGNAKGDTLLVTTRANIALQMPIAGVYRNELDLASSGLTALTSVVGAAMAPSPGTISGAISGVANAIKAAQPHAVGGGMIGGGLSAISAPKYFETRRYTPVFDDNTDHGRPLCEIAQISNHSGYLLLADGNIEISGTQEEMAEINSYLTGGFFYE